MELKIIYFLDGFRCSQRPRLKTVKQEGVDFKMIQHSVSQWSCKIGMCNS